MQIIDSISIKNFRSIDKLSQNLNPRDLNVVIGLNDSGKSTLLKALNLFFNGCTEQNVKFRFDDDFCKFAQVRKHAAPEIEISLTFNIPDHYKNKGKMIWTKKWRRDGFYDEKIKDVHGKSYEKGKGKEVAWLRKIRYFYVPAIRDERYFNDLMGNIYDTLSEVDSEVLQKSSLEFALGVKNQVGALVSEISSKLEYDSSITTPSDFRLLFATLDFELDSNGNRISLMKHGDGIKALHIPIILKFIAQTLHKQKGKQINSDVVWGFEEPENNLEMGKSFALADIFKNYSNELQIFVTTHSPAFYSLAKTGDNLLLWAEKDGNGKTIYSEADYSFIKQIDSRIGILPIVSDYIEEEVKKKQELEQTLDNVKKQLQAKDKIFIITEGKTDVVHLKTAFENLYPKDSLRMKLSYFDFSGNATLGDDLEKLTQNLLKMDNVNKIVVIVDRDKKIYPSSGKLNYQKLGNNVFRFSIPALTNAERKTEDKICIEHYYSNKEIQSNVGNGKHIYLGRDFSSFGMSTDQKYFFAGYAKNKNIWPCSIIDAANKHISPLCGTSTIASKDDFANYVSQNPQNFKFDNFKKIYEVLKEIDKE